MLARYILLCRLATAVASLPGCSDTNHVLLPKQPQPCREHERLIVSVAGRPCWSPDADRVAYLVGYYDSTGLPVRQIRTIGATGGTSTLVFDFSNTADAIMAYAWSSSRDRIVASVNNQAIVTIEIDGGATRTWAAGNRFVYDPAWSADGRYILYTRSRGAFEPDTMGGLYQLDTSDGSQRPFLLEKGNGIYPSGPVQYSPDGSLVVFSIGRSDPRGAVLYDLFVARADGTGLRQLTRLDGSALNPQWSGNTRVFFDFTPGVCLPTTSLDRATWVINIDGTNVYQWSVNFGDSQVQAGFPFAISPDGLRVAYTAVDTTKAHGVIWISSLDGSGRKQLTLP